MFGVRNQSVYSHYLRNTQTAMARWFATTGALTTLTHLNTLDWNLISQVRRGTPPHWTEDTRGISVDPQGYRGD